MCLAALIAAQRVEHGIPHAVSCRAVGVSQAWFYKWKRGDRSSRRKRRTALAAVVAYLFALHHGSYGSPRITADLHAMGWRVSANTVARLMAEQGLVARRRRRRRSTTRPDRSGRKAPDALRRDSRPPSRPNTRWVSDLTEISTDEGKFYLAAILDLHSRRCVGFAMGAHHNAELARAALAIAIRGGSIAGVIFHSDQGSEYTGRVFAQACRSAGYHAVHGPHRIGAGQRGRRTVNATLELELLSHQRFATREQARHAVATWIDEHNTERRHSTNGMLSPVDYEHVHATTSHQNTARQAPPHRRVA